MGSRNSGVGKNFYTVTFYYTCVGLPLLSPLYSSRARAVVTIHYTACSSLVGAPQLELRRLYALTICDYSTYTTTSPFFGGKRLNGMVLAVVGSRGARVRLTGLCAGTSHFVNQSQPYANKEVTAGLVV